MMNEKPKNHVLKKYLSFQLMFVFVLLPTWYICLFAVESSVKERLVANALAASLAYDGDLLQEIDSADHSAFKKVEKINSRLEALHPDIRFVYTMRKDAEGRIVFLVDSMSLDRDGDGVIGEDEKAAGLGELYKNPTKDMLSAFYVASADSKPNTDRWGTFISGYAPIYNSNSEVVAIVGLDMDIETFRSKQDQMSLAFLIGGLMSFVLSFVLAFLFKNK